MRRVLAFLLLLALGACGGSDTVAVPAGVTFQVEQARQDLQGRNIEIQVVNNGSKTITVSSAEFTSKRIDGESIYHGPATIPAGATTNLTLAMAPARCGKGIQATIRVHYQVGDGKAVTSEVRPKDHYGSVALAMLRDCAEGTLRKLTIDKKLTVRGTGSGSVLEVGMTFAPKDGEDPVRLGPVDGTTLLKPAPGSSIDHELRPGTDPYHAVLEVIPNRCDVHVVAEDRTGATMPLHVDSKESGPAFFYLRFTEPQKAQIFDFIAHHCGFGVEKDPLFAP
jgi:hypothetical protein